MPRYMMLIVEAEDGPDEAQVGGVDWTPGKPPFDEIAAMHGSFAAEVAAANATIVATEALLPVSTATFLRNTRSSDVWWQTTRRPIRPDDAPGVRRVHGIDRRRLPLPTATMAARLTRAKKRISESGIGIELPDDVAVEESWRRTPHDPPRVHDGTHSRVGEGDDDLAAVARRMARTLHDLRPGDPEGLLALIELSEAGARSIQRNHRSARWRAGRQPAWPARPGIGP